MRAERNNSGVLPLHSNSRVMQRRGGGHDGVGVAGQQQQVGGRIVNDDDTERSRAGARTKKASALAPSADQRSPAAMSVYLCLSLVALAILICIRSSKRRGWWTILTLLAIPVLMALFVAVRGQHANEKLVAGAFVMSILSNQLPKSITALAAALVAAAFSLATRPVQSNGAQTSGKYHNDGNKGPGGGGSSSESIERHLKTKAVLSCIFMIAVLLHENFQVWVVSATYTPSHEPPYPESLQDNGRIVMRKLAAIASLQRRDVQKLRDVFSVQWALVASAVAGALVGCELKLGTASHRNMFAVAMRALLTLGIVRFVRTISFLLTVLPSQMPSCYRSHYPYPVPDTWREWIMVGLKPAARGGCNDLIISGHATVTSVLACVGVSVADNAIFSVAVWSLLAFDYLVEVYQGYHYSVDMWMGAIITSLIFRSLASVEPKDVAGGEGQKYLPLSSITVGDGILYTGPALLAFIIITVSREAIANMWIVLYVTAAAVAQYKGDTHFSRHIFVCTLYIALIVYL